MFKLLQGNVSDVIKTVPDNSIHCVVTSPPYFGLRDYGTATWIGGDSACNHNNDKKHLAGKLDKNYVPGNSGNGIYKTVCKKCGAIRVDEQIGIEETPEQYIDNLCAVFDEIYRVLNSMGTVWLNLGDTYFSSSLNKHKTLKPKDLIGIPWRVALALQERGWFLRQDIIWHKPNAMPSPSLDRCVTAHEYVFLLSKSGSYFFNADNIKEPYTKPMNRWGGDVLKADGIGSDWDVATGQTTYRNRNMRPDPNGKNCRSVWSINTKPFKDAHFAVMPEELADRCVKASVSSGCCSVCYMPVNKEGLKTCACDSDIIPCRVLDPFSGAGTTGVVALKHGHNFIGIELNKDYVTIANRRLLALEESANTLF